MNDRIEAVIDAALADAYTATEFLAALKAAHIECVELADEDADGNWWVPSCGSFNGMESTGDSVISVEITDDGIEADTFGGMTPEEARLLAAALLAAAAEADQ